MFRQTGNSAPEPSKHGQLLVAAEGGSGPGTDVTIVDPLGQQTMADSVAVVIASNQTAVPVSGPLTDVQLRATPVPISGTVTANVTNPLPVTGSGTAGTAATGVVSVQGIASMTPVQVSQATASALNAQVQGPAAHSATTVGNPLLSGNEAIAFGTNPTAVDAGEVTKAYANRAGVPFVLGGHPNIITLEAEYTSAQTNTAIISVSGGTKIAVTQIQGIADAATSVDVGFRVGFATATTPTTTGVVLTHPGIKATSGSGVSRGDGSAVIGVGADGEDLRITSEVPTGGALRILVSYFTIES